MPQVREFLVNAQRYGRGELAALFHGIDLHDDPVTARLVGAFHQAPLAGVMLQWLVDPEEAPSAEEINPSAPGRGSAVGRGAHLVGMTMPTDP